MAGKASSRAARRSSPSKATRRGYKTLSAKSRARMKKSTFGLPGRRAYPLNDANHARVALGMVARHGTKSEQKRVRAAVRKKYPSIKVTPKKA